MLRRSPVRAARAVVAAVSGAFPRLNQTVFNQTVFNQTVVTPERFGSPISEALEPRRLMSVNVTTYHYNNAETGANTSETTLTLNNVNTSDFGKVASMNVSGQIYGQPLIMTGVSMGYGEGTHDIVLVTTETDLVYAFDAYGNNPAQGYLWKTSLLQTGETPVPETDYGTTDITPEIGITGTPVINPATGILYVVGLFKESNATYEQRIYALNISTGTNAIAPVAITASVSGTGYDQVGDVITFNAFRENQRPALTLANGEVYVGWSSHGDQNPWHGWLIAYNAATLHQDYVYCNTADGEQGGIWMSGGGISVDSSGNLYYTSGNGTFDANTSVDYAMTLEELSPSLTPEQYFAPYNQQALSNADLDYGCANVILLTGQGGSDPNEVLSAGKWGTIYLNNMASLGGYNSNGTGPNTDLGEATLAGANTSTSNVHNTMVYWNGSVYLGGDALTLQAFSVANGVLGTTPSSQTSHVFGSSSVEDGQGAGLTVSSNGNSNGIIWALDNTGFLQSSAVLYAYNASNLAQTPLWTSSSAANNRDAAGVAIKFQDPVVANGHVYVAGDGTLTVYGLLSASTSTPTLTAPASASPSPVTGTTATLSVTGTDPNGDLSPNYTWAATSIPSGATTPTFSINGTNNADNTVATFYKAGAYTFTATIEDPNSGLTTTSSVTVTVNQTLTAISVTPSTATVIDATTQQFTASANDQFGLAMSSQPTFSWSVTAGGAGGTVSSTGLYTAPASGTGTDIVTATSGSSSTSATVTVAIPSSTSEISLTSYFNHFGIASSGTHSIPAPGIDGDQDGLADSILGTTQSWNGSSFIIGPTTTANNTNNVVDGTGQTITLSPGRYTAIKLLAMHWNGSATDSFTLNYSDGSTQTITQGFSDWFTPQKYTGESQAVAMSYRITSNGHSGTGPFYLYGYAFTPIYSKTLVSITLPSDAQLDIIAMDTVGTLVPTVTTAASANPATVTGTTTALSAGGTDPTGDASPIFTWVATNMPSGAVAPAFSRNGTTTANLSTATFHTAGAYTFTVYITDPTTGFNVSSSVNVTVSQTLTSISVSPIGPVALTNGKTQQFTASALDQFGNTLSSQPTFAWSLGGSSIGSVSSSGLYQAPASGVGSATVVATSGGVTGQTTVQVNQPAWLGAGSAAVYNSSTHVLTVTGAATIIADPGSDQPIIQANGSSAVVTINPTSALEIHIGGLSLTHGASATVASLGSARTSTNHRVLVLGLPGAATAPLLTVDSTSHLDLTDNDLIDHDGSISAITGLLASGFNAGAGYWNGNGIVSSIAAAKTSTTLGSGQPVSAGTVDGETVSGSDVEVLYTYYGDATLDGHVDGSDYSKIDNGFLNQLTGFSNGDFNYDGVVDGSDYTLIDNEFNAQAASLDSVVATPTAEVATASAKQAKPTLPISIVNGVSVNGVSLAKLLSGDVKPVALPDLANFVAVSPKLGSSSVSDGPSIVNAGTRDYRRVFASGSSVAKPGTSASATNFSNVAILAGDLS